MNSRQYYTISGKVNGKRLDSRLLEEQIQEAVAQGHYRLVVKSCGQHGIGGRLWRTGGKQVVLQIHGPVGQRVGAMGTAGAAIEVMGPASDDVGWLNAGATIVVHGNAGNGTANAMAQGKIFIGGDIGARGMTMTKHNPRFDPPELWVLGSAGDYFGEFMAGGVAVICGYEAQNPGNVLGYRPLVGMVGGKVYFRGSHHGFSRADAKMTPIDDDAWNWLRHRLDDFLKRIQRSDLVDELTHRETWQCLRARGPKERLSPPRREMRVFRKEVWEETLGPGGLVGDLTDLDRGPIGLITRGGLRRFVPVWENHKYKAPCEAACPTGIPVQQRWQMVRSGRIDEAIDMALAYTPFPATVCGYLCSNLCMQSCTKQTDSMAPVDVTQLGKASIKAKTPDLPPLTGKTVAVIGGGPAGLSIAWQLRLKGHQATVYDTNPVLGGKITRSIPQSRIPEQVIDHELERITQVIAHVHLQQNLSKEDIENLISDHDFVVLATGASKPRGLPIPGKEHLVTALAFLSEARRGTATVGKRVVIIGAGNVGCDVATEAARLGAEDITLIDVQRPASFGKEREAAEQAGAKFRWPAFAQSISRDGVRLEDGELLPADSVIAAIGDSPDLDCLPADIAAEHGFIKVDANYRTSNAKVYAIGDVVRPGLLTDAIGAGRRAAHAIDALLRGGRPAEDTRDRIDIRRVHLEYYDPRIVRYDDMEQCGSQCASCGQCRDCGICAAVCPENAISRSDGEKASYEYVADPERCIACGFCADACPCGIWALWENTPIE